MFGEVLLAAAFQVLPFYEQRPAADYYAFRPLYATEGEVTDVLWPVFTTHRDWWRFCYAMHYQSYPDDGYQFEIIPIWFNGRSGSKTEAEGPSYAALFPIAGYHPHIFLIYDWKFVLWPLWMQYKMPRPNQDRWLTTNTVLWPLVHWRDDGSWGFWPFYVCNHQRESFHQTALWPIFTWAKYEADRDTGGAGSSWMVWPLYGQIRREREDQDLFLPPLFSYARTRPVLRKVSDDSPEIRVRCPWPIVDIERTFSRDRTSIFPLYERVDWKTFAESSKASSVTRFGWKLVELYDDETRVFPFWVSRKDDAYFRLWPFYESERAKDGVTYGSFLSLFPIRWVPAVDRNWSKFWTLYERAAHADHTDHALFWGIIRWSTSND